MTLLNVEPRFLIFKFALSTVIDTHFLKRRASRVSYVIRFQASRYAYCVSTVIIATSSGSGIPLRTRQIMFQFDAFSGLNLAS